MKIVTLKPEQFDKYAKNHKYRHYYQTSAYAKSLTKLKNNIHYLGFVDNNNKLIGATFITYKEVLMSYKIAYAPRGILFDYDNSVKTKDIIDKLKKQLSKQGFILLRMDPYIPLNIKKTNGDILNINNETNNICENIQLSGFKYKGRNELFETEHLRYEALLMLNKTTQEIFDHFSSTTKEKINISKKNSVIVTKDEQSDIETIYKYIKQESNKPLAYYMELKNNFQENFKIYKAKIESNSFVINSRKLYEQELQNNNQLNENMQLVSLSNEERNKILDKKMKSDNLLTIYKNNILDGTELLKKYPNGITLGAVIIIEYDNVANIIVEGYNKKYKDLYPEYLLKWQLICEYKNRNFKYINLGEVTGNLLNEKYYKDFNYKKLCYNPFIIENIGEFDLILNNFAYNLYKNSKK